MIVRGTILVHPVPSVDKILMYQSNMCDITLCRYPPPYPSYFRLSGYVEHSIYMDDIRATISDTVIALMRQNFPAGNF